MFTEALLFVIACLLVLRLLTQKPEKYPPGPQRWPIVGNRFQLRKWGSMPHLSMAEAARRYGNIVGLYSGSIPMVLVSSLDAIKEVSMREDLSGRPHTVVATKIDKGSYGVLFTFGEKWKQQRRFILRHLRDLGFGKRSLEVIVHEELQDVFVEIDRLSGGHKTGWANTVPVHNILGTAGINVLWYIIAGQRYSHADQYLYNLMDNVKKLLALSEPGGRATTAFPIIAKLFPYLSNLPKFVTLRNTLIQFIQDEVNKHKESMDHDHPRDFMDIYLSEMDKQKDNVSSAFKEKQLVHACIDLFMTGSETTLNSFTFSILYMILYPNVQHKVQEELDRIVGKERLPSLEDRAHLQYVEATLHEVLRISSVVPLAVPHAPLYAERDTEFQGYVIPKDSRVILNLYTLHHDPKIWGDPENFRPERFIDENGKFFRHEALIAFGTGKRACLGEALARNNLFLFFTGVMHRYHMKVPDGQTKPSEEPEGGLTLMPKKFTVKVEIRK